MDGKNIREITPEGVVYLDENGEEKFIDFAACHENYLKQMTSHESRERIMQVNRMSDLDWAQFLERVKRFRQIGARQPLTPPWDDGPYVEFQTEPPIRFKFATAEEYQKVLYAIGQAGWKTFDRS